MSLSTSQLFSELVVPAGRMSLDYALSLAKDIPDDRWSEVAIDGATHAATIPTKRCSCSLRSSARSARGAAAGAQAVRLACGACGLALERVASAPLPLDARVR